jgi:hypothetical protein
LCSITSHVIGAQSINGDQYNAGLRNARLSDTGRGLRFRWPGLGRRGLRERRASG